RVGAEGDLLGPGGDVVLHVPIFSALGMDEQVESVAITDLVSLLFRFEGQDFLVGECHGRLHGNRTFQEPNFREPNFMLPPILPATKAWLGANGSELSRTI